MHRSVLHLLRNKSFDLKGVFLGNTNGSVRNERISWSCVQRLTKSPQCSSVFLNSFHTTACMSDEIGSKNGNDKPSKPTKGKKRNARVKKDELHSAAIDAAKSLPGDWTQVAEELMSRLTIQQSSTKLKPKNVGQEQGSVSSKPTSRSRLSTMRVAKESNQQGMKPRHMARGVPRQPETFNSLYSQPPLGIFKAEKLTAKATNDTMKDKEEDLWLVVQKEKIRRESGDLPRNGFEEMIQWTKEGRMWTFPIDNEEDMHEERQYEFHEHVFLSQHLKDFPKDGPIRRFMDLVVLGLSNNPWVSVPEKVEHIRWYADYFHQKQQLLESSIGEKAKMKQS